MLATRVVGPRFGAQTAAADLTAALLGDYRWRSIGPGSAGGRITDVEALDSDFRFVIAAAVSLPETPSGGKSLATARDH